MNPSAEAAVVSTSSPPLSQRVRTGAFVTLIGFGAGQALRLGSNLILSRLLVPEAFGLMSIVSLFLQGLTMFSDVGITPALVQHPRALEERFQNTAWTMQVIRGGVLFACTCLIAWPVSRFYADSRLLSLLPAVGFNAAILGLRSTAPAVLNRKLVLGRQTAIDVVTQVLSVIAMVAWALVDRSVWALVVGGVVGGSASVLLSHVWLPGIRNRFLLDPEIKRELFRYGRWITASTAFTFLASQGDRAILSTFLSLSVLGVYSVASNMSQLLLMIASRLYSVVLFPVYSEWGRGKAGELRTKFLLQRNKVLAVFLVPGCLLAVLGEPLIHVLYDSRYHDAGWMLSLMAIGALVHVLTMTLDSVLLATGDSRGHMVYTFSKGTIGIIAMIVGGYLGGLYGLLIGNIVGRALQYPMVVLAVRKKGVWTPLVDLAAVLLCAGIVLVGRMLVSDLF